MTTQRQNSHVTLPTARILYHKLPSRHSEPTLSQSRKPSLTKSPVLSLFLPSRKNNIYLRLLFSIDFLSHGIVQARPTSAHWAYKKVQESCRIPQNGKTTASRKAITSTLHHKRERDKIHLCYRRSSILPWERHHRRLTRQIAASTWVQGYQPGNLTLT